MANKDKNIRCSFCGTANGVNILHDITGNRRFLCQNVKRISYSKKDLNHGQIYAQAYELFKTGFSFDTPDAIDLNLMKNHLVALKEGLTIKSPRYDFVTCESFPDGEEKTITEEQRGRLNNKHGQQWGR